MWRLIKVLDSTTSQFMNKNIKINLFSAIDKTDQKNVIAALIRMMNGVTIILVLSGALKSQWIPIRCEKYRRVDADDKAKKLVKIDASVNESL